MKDGEGKAGSWRGDTPNCHLHTPPSFFVAAAFAPLALTPVVRKIASRSSVVMLPISPKITRGNNLENGREVSFRGTTLAGGPAIRRLLLSVGAGASLAAAEPPDSPSLPPESHPHQVIVVNSLGEVSRVSTNALPASLRPPASVGFDRQLPMPARGTLQSKHIFHRIQRNESAADSWRWFPETPPTLAPYWANIDEFGVEAVQLGGLFSTDPLSQAAQSAKYWLSDLGLRESFYQSVSLTKLSETVSGNDTLAYYAATFWGKWAVFAQSHGGPAGWLSAEIDVVAGLTSASRAESPQANFGSLINPQNNVSGPNGIWISELAWQQSFRDGRLVFLAGQLDQGNYLDVNAYANNSQSQFLNAAFVNNSALPLPSNNLGVTAQWQPADWWYVQLAAGANNQTPGQSPFDDLSGDNWSYLAELGWSPNDVLGWGPGVYRLQPFVVTIDGRTQAGVGLNLQQKLGKKSPFAAFSRFGVGGAETAWNGVQAQASVGLAVAAPLQALDLAPRLSNDLLGSAFVWSQASPSIPSQHEHEMAWETFYALQLTPTMRLQPDVQVVWNRAYSPDSGPAVVWQLQLNIAW